MCEQTIEFHVSLRLKSTVGVSYVFSYEQRDGSWLFNIEPLLVAPSAVACSSKVGKSSATRIGKLKDWQVQNERKGEIWSSYEFLDTMLGAIKILSL